MKKLKDILKESNVWDRKFGQSLPTLADTTARHAAKNKIKEADVFTPGDKFGGRDSDTSTDPKDVQKLVDKLKSNQAIKLAVKKINMKNEVAPAIIAFAQLLNDQVPGALTSGKRQQIIKAMKEME